MLKMEWNALRVGNHVLLHDPAHPASALVPATVVIVQPAQGTNEIGVRVPPAGDHWTVVWPRRLAAHLDPRDPAEPCWQCDALVASSSTR